MLLLLFCCYVFVCILFVVGCFDFVIVDMIYGIYYFIIYCIAYVVLFSVLLLFVVLIYIVDLLFPMWCPVCLFPHYPIEIGCIIKWAVREKDKTGLC